MSLATVQVRMEPSDIDKLGKEAQALDIPRAVYIRQLLLDRAKSKGANFTPDQLNRLIADAYHQSNLPRNEVERLVYFVFARLMR